MSHSLLLSRCLNTPLLLEEAKLNVLTSEVFLKLLVNEPINRSQNTPEPQDPTKVLDKIAVIHIHGSLVNKNGSGASGVTSYERIRNNIVAAIEEGTKHIVFDIASSGGEASGNFPLASLIKSLPEKYGVKTYGFTDSMAYSGGYSLLAATEVVYATDMAGVGSIGAVASLVDTTKADAKAGLGYKIIRSRDKKQAYNPHEGITDVAVEEVTTQLKAWDKKFFDTVLEYRPNVTLTELEKLDGGTLPASEGIKIGLVDKIVASIDEIFPEILGKNTGVNIDKGNITMATHEETLAQLVDTQAKLAAVTASKELDIKQAVQVERERALKILEAQQTFGISNQMAVNAITKGFSLEVVTEMFTEVKANLDAATAITTTAASQGSVTQATVADIAKLGQTQVEEKDKSLGGGTFSMGELLTAMGQIGGGA